MLKEFRERAGLPADGALRDLHTEWVDILPGSKAGRFLMGAGNQLRWVENRELRDRMNRIVDGIEACKQPNGYLMAYPERDILHFENGAYCRSWVTQGLIEAGIAGNPKAYPLLRGFYDWFNACPYLPEMVGQGQDTIFVTDGFPPHPVQRKRTRFQRQKCLRYRIRPAADGRCRRFGAKRACYATIPA
jgi:hypothetical protein